MKKSYIAYLFFMILPFFPANSCLAFWCGTDLITIGDTQEEVLEACGEPDWVESGLGPVPPELRPLPLPYRMLLESEVVNIDRWYYNLGPNQFIRILTFDLGVLTDIEMGEYGF